MLADDNPRARHEQRYCHRPCNIVTSSARRPWPSKWRETAVNVSRMVAPAAARAGEAGEGRRAAIQRARRCRLWAPGRAIGDNPAALHRWRRFIRYFNRRRRNVVPAQAARACSKGEVWHDVHLGLSSVEFIDVPLDRLPIVARVRRNKHAHQAMPQSPAARNKILSRYVREA